MWFEPFRFSGNYYNQFPTNVLKEWTEILDGRDFFDFNSKVDVIVTNPPFSILGTARKPYTLEKMRHPAVLRKCVELQPRVISLLTGVLNVSLARTQFMKQNGYHIAGEYRCAVDGWFGSAVATTYVKSASAFDFRVRQDTATYKLVKLTAEDFASPVYRSSEGVPAPTTGMCSMYV